MRRARVSRASRAWRVRAANDKVKIGDFAAPHNLSYTTRANIAHEKAEQIRARIVCTPAEKRWAGVGKVLALTGWGDGLRRMAGGAWRGGKICRKAAERIDSIHKMHHT